MPNYNNECFSTRSVGGVRSAAVIVACVGSLLLWPSVGAVSDPAGVPGGGMAQAVAGGVSAENHKKHKKAPFKNRAKNKKGVLQ